MESPRTWTFMIAALAVAGLDAPERAWDFLVDTGAVGNRADVREAFLAAVAAVRAEGPITGPSEAARVAQRMAGARGLTFKSHERDAEGTRAHASFEEFLARGAPSTAPIPRPWDTVYCCSCGAVTRMSAVTCPACGRAPLDALALMVELGYSSATHRPCPRCATASCFDPYCWYCGAPIDDG